MKKKKIISAIAAVAVVASLSIGSLAWFTSQDSVTNKFSTVSTDNPSNANSGIDINEDFDKTTAQKVLPGTEVKKLVKVDSKAQYDQLVKVKLETVWTNSRGDKVDSYKVTTKIGQDTNGNNIKLEDITYYDSSKDNTPKDAKKLDLSLIKLNFGDNLGNSEGKWIDGKEGTYYYNGILKPGATTNALLNSVTLDKKADNVYKNLKFNVIVTADGIQASNGAVSDGWKEAPQAIKDLGGVSK